MSKILEPDAFRGQPLAWAGNQCGHFVLGMFSAFFICVTFFYVIGELPYRAHVFWIIALAYVSFEVYGQGWRGWDTVDDTVFVVAYGTGGTLAGFTEHQVGSLQPVPDMQILTTFAVVMTAHLIMGMVFRLE